MRTSTLVALALSTALAAAAPAQYPAVQTPADQLAAVMRRLAVAPTDVYALIQAGELSVKLDDMSAAAAFFARADKIDGRNGRVKAGMASILVRAERPGEALRYYQMAEAFGLDPARFAADRGLAYDLLGEQERAQRDYRLALRTVPDDETVRRYALSLGVSGRREEALDQLVPLIRRQDRAAWRSRAFILAMTGDVPGANKIAASVMPAGMASGLRPFFDRLPTLSAADRAFAVHFGEVRPTPARLADAGMKPYLPPIGADPYAPAVRVAAAPTPPPAARVVERARTPVVRRPDPRDRVTLTARPRTEPPAATRPPVTRTPPVQVASVRPYSPFPQAVASPVTRPVPAPTPATSPPVQVASAAPPPIASPVVTALSTAPPTATPAPTFVQPAPQPVATAAGTAPVGPGFTAPAPITVAPITVATASTAPAPAFTATAPVLASAPAAPVTAVRSEDSILARIVASISVPGEELGVREPVRRAVPPAPAPAAAIVAADPVARRTLAVGQAKAARETADRAAAARTIAAARAKPPEAAPVRGRRVARTEEAEAAKPRTAAERRAAARKAAAEKRKEPADPERIWVQVAGGASERDLPRAWSTAQKKAAALKGRQAYVTPQRATNRVVTGPFKTAAEARAFVNQLAKQGVSAFQFTSAAGQKMTELRAE